MNPQVAKKLEIIKKSKDIFFTGIGFTRKNINPEFNETLEVITSDVNDIKRDMESISFINIQHVYPVVQSELSELDKLYKEYKNFKKRKMLKK